MKENTINHCRFFAYNSGLKIGGANRNPWPTRAELASARAGEPDFVQVVLLCKLRTEGFLVVEKFLQVFASLKRLEIFLSGNCLLLACKLFRINQLPWNS